MYFLDFRLLLFQPENVAKINLEKNSKQSIFSKNNFFFQINNKSDSVASQYRGDPMKM